MSLPPSADPAGTPAVSTRSIALLATASFASAANIRLPDALLPQVSADFAVSVGTASVIVTGYTIAYGLLQAFYGPIGDRYGKYRVIAITTLLSALATLACALAPTLEMLAGARFLAAAVSCAIIPLGMAWIGDVVPYDRRQAVLSRFISGQILGLIFGQIAGGVVGDLIGWRMTFVVVAGVYVAAATAIFAEMRFDPRTRTASNPTASLSPVVVVAQFSALLRQRWVRVVLLTVCLEGMLFFGAFAFVGNELHERFGLSLTVVGLALTAYGVGGMTYAFSARHLLRLLGERGLALGGSATMTVGFAALAVAPSLPWAVLGILVSGLGFYMFHNTLQTHGTQMAPQARGSGVSLFASSLFIGQSIGVALAALVIDRWGAIPVFAGAGLLLPAVALYFALSLPRKP